MNVYFRLRMRKCGLSVRERCFYNYTVSPNASVGSFWYLKYQYHFWRIRSKCRILKVKLNTEKIGRPQLYTVPRAFFNHFIYSTVICYSNPSGQFFHRCSASSPSLFYYLFYGQQCFTGNKNTCRMNTITTSRNRVAYFL